jgi:predicted dehydrogenase
MAKTYRVGAIGFAHMHINHLLDEFAKLPNVEWVACADTKPSVPEATEKRSTRGWNMKVHAMQTIGIPKGYDCWQEMLDKEELDIVVFCPENAKHGEVGAAIAAKGIDMVTEKPMAATLAEALKLARAVRANDVKLMVNWPTTWSTAVRKMKELIDAGVIGDVWEVKWRNGASLGPLSYGSGEDEIFPLEKGPSWWHRSEAGGGVLLDYCCYGACLSRWFIGEPAVACLGIKANLCSPYGNAEDNAIITVRYPKALTILEATWTTWATGVATGPIVYGTKGCLVATSRDHKPVVEVFTSRSHGAAEPDQVLEGDPLPVGRATLAEEFIHHLETGEPLHPTLQLEHNIEAMAILDAGIRSAASGKLELVNDMQWCIG